MSYITTNQCYYVLFITCRYGLPVIFQAVLLFVDMACLLISKQGFQVLCINDQAMLIFVGMVCQLISKQCSYVHLQRLRKSYVTLCSISTVTLTTVVVA